MSNANDIYAHVDSRFDSLKLAANELYIRNAKGVPHCECKGALVAAGIKVSAKYYYEELFEMVPTTTTDGFSCAHCSHAAFFKPLTAAVREVKKERKSTRRPANRAAPVVGLNPQTGERVRFPSARAASRAGYGDVASYMRAGRALNGWLWQRDESAYEEAV